MSYLRTVTDRRTVDASQGHPLLQHRARLVAELGHHIIRGRTVSKLVRYIVEAAVRPISTRAWVLVMARKYTVVHVMAAAIDHAYATCSGVSTPFSSCRMWLCFRADLHVTQNGPTPDPYSLPSPASPWCPFAHADCLAASTLPVGCR